MKKRLLYWSAFLALLLTTTDAYSSKVYTINETFSSAPAANWGFTTVSGQTFTYESVAKRLQIRWGSPTSFTTKAFTTAIAPGTDNKVTVEAIVSYSNSGSSSSAGNLYFLDTNGNAIFGVCFGRFSSNWRIARATTYPGAIAPTAYPTTTDVLAANSPIAKITAVLNFSTHTLDYTAQVGTFDDVTRIFTATTPSVSSTSQAFISASASDLKTLLSSFYRGSSTSGSFGYDLMYMGISSEQVVPTASATVRYKDQDGNYFKSDEVIPEQVVGGTYNATITEKTSVNTGGNYYVFDPSSPTSVTVNTGGSTLELLFRRATFFPSSIWNGTADSNGNLWSEWYNNCINGVTSVGYQRDASITFDATAINPSVLVNDNINLGTGNYTVGTTGYTFSGAGALSGTGAMNINLSSSDVVSVGVTNNMTGRTQIAGGTVTVTKAGALGANVDVNGITTFISTASLPNIAFLNDGYIQPTAGTSIAGMSISSGYLVSISSATNNASGVSSFNITPTGTVSGNLDLNGTNTDIRWGLASANAIYFQNARLSLLGSSMIFVDTNQGAASTISIGSLTGEAGARLGWGRSSNLDRTITWSVGGLNESSTYAGTIINTGGYNTGGAFYTGNLTNFAKVGSGVLTFSGTANTHNGNFDVSGGELKVTGNIGKATSTMSVSSTGLLSAKEGGTITVGTLNVGATAFFEADATSTVALTTVNVTATGTSAGRLTLRNGTVIPTLNILATEAPAKGTSIQVVFASDLSTISYTNVPTVPAGYSFNQTTGMLTYNGTDVTTNTSASTVTYSYTKATYSVASGALFTIDQNINGSVVVAVGGKLTIDATKTLTGNVTLESDATGTATLIDNGAISGTVTAKQFLTGSTNSGTGLPNGRFWYVSSPVVGATSAVFTPSAGNKFWGWDEPNGNYTSLITTDGVAMTKGLGYIVRLKSNTTAVFTGAPNTGDATVGITRTGATNLYRGFNLIGNPYPSFARIKATDNTNIEPSLWFRTKVSDSNNMIFDTYNIATGDSVSGSGNAISGYIPPMQAFWVKTMTPDASNVTFKQAYRFHSDPITSGIKLRSANIDSTVCLRIRLTNGNSKDETLIKLYPNASDAFDKYDSHKMTNNVDSFPEIFTMNGNEELAINGLRHDGRSKTLALGFRTGKKGNFKFKVLEMKNLGDSLRVILKDKIKNCEKVLTDSSEYDFTSEVATTSDRFSIVITANAPTSLKDVVNTADADAFSTIDNQIQIRLIGTSDNKARITVYSTLGQQVGSFTTNATTTLLNQRFAPGIYLVNIVAEGVQVTKKVVIN